MDFCRHIIDTAENIAKICEKVCFDRAKVAVNYKTYHVWMKCCLELVRVVISARVNFSKPLLSAVRVHCIYVERRANSAAAVRRRATLARPNKRVANTVLLWADLRLLGEREVLRPFRLKMIFHVADKKRDQRSVDICTTYFFGSNPRTAGPQLPFLRRPVLCLNEMPGRG